MSMQVSVEARDGLECSIRVQVPAARIDDEVEVRLKKVARTAKMKGFRPGKIPPKVVRQQFGGAVRQEVLEEVLQASYNEAIEQEKLRPAGGPTIDPESIEAGKDLAYKATFEVYPEVEVTGVEKIKLEKPAVDVADSDIDDMIEKLRKQHAEWEVVERASEEGDEIKVDFEGKLDGEVFEGGSGEDVPVVLGEGQMLEDFEKNLYGLAAGDEKEFKLKFPKDYFNDELAGKKVVFSVTAKTVSAPKLPEVDEEFVQRFGVEGDADAFRAHVSENMTKEADAKAQSEVKRQLLDGLLEANPIELPNVLVTQEMESLQKDAMQRMGITDDSQLPNAEGYREAAEKRVRLGLLMSAVIQDNELTADRDRVLAKLDELTAGYPQPEEIRKLYQQNAQMMAQVENITLEESVVDWLTDKAKVTEKAYSFKDLMEL